MKSKLKKLGHILAGFLILLHGIGKIETDEHFPWFYFIMGFIVLTLALFHEKIEAISKYTDGIFCFIESIMVFFIAIDLFEADKKFLPWFYVIASLMYFYAGYRLISKTKNTK